MRSNLGALHRGVRLLVAVAAIVGAIVVGAGSVGGILLFVVAGVMAVTGLVGFCPLYALLGLYTHRHGRRLTWT